MESLAEHAVVVGAGIAGCLSAAVLSRHFAQVSLLERDAIDAETAGVRRGLPQASHSHVVLRGGLDAMERILPGLEAELCAHGAITLQPAQDLLTVTAKGPLPQRAVGPTTLAQSRWLLDRLIRTRVAALPNVRFLAGHHVEGLAGDSDRVTGVRLQAGSQGELLLADLVVDASGRAARCLTWLPALGVELPEQTRVRRELRYATRVLRIPDGGAPTAVSILPTPDNRRGALLLPIEGRRWMLTLNCPAALCPSDEDSFEAYVQALPARQIAECVRGAEREGALARFAFADSCQRHFERCVRWPRNLLCIGDAICNFNPFYGQGMSVAALEVEALAKELVGRPAGQAWDHGLAARFFYAAAEIISTPWTLSTYPDLAEPEAEGVRPADFAQVLAQQRALLSLALRDGEVQGRHLEALHLVRPWSSLLEPPLGERVAALLRARSQEQPSAQT